MTGPSGHFPSICKFYEHEEAEIFGHHLEDEYPMDINHHVVNLNE